MTWAFGVEEFQLVLLRRMADFQPELVEAARKGLGVSATGMREVNADWQRFCRSRTAPKGLGRYTAVLGAPEEVAERKVGDLACRLHHWRMPLWPELRFEVVAGPGGEAWQEWLVRAPGGVVPDAPADGAMEPWGFVVGDVERRYRGVRHLPPDAPSRWVSEFSVAPPTLRRKAWFVWGLLQVVSEPYQA